MRGLCPGQHLSVFDLSSPKYVSTCADRDLSVNMSSAQVHRCLAVPLSYYFVTEVKLP